MTESQPTETAVYAERGSTALTLDVFAPTAAWRRTAVLVFHGGGWRAGAKEMVYGRACGLAAAGFTAIVVQSPKGRRCVLQSSRPRRLGQESVGTSLSEIEGGRDDLRTP